MQTVDQCRWSHLDRVAQPHVSSNRGGLPSLHLMIELRQFGRSAAISTEWHWLARYWPGKLWASKERGGVTSDRQTDRHPPSYALCQAQVIRFSTSLGSQTRSWRAFFQEANWETGQAFEALAFPYPPGQFHACTPPPFPFIWMQANPV